MIRYFWMVTNRLNFQISKLLLITWFLWTAWVTVRCSFDNNPIINACGSACRYHSCSICSIRIALNNSKTNSQLMSRNLKDSPACTVIIDLFVADHENFKRNSQTERTASREYVRHFYNDSINVDAYVKKMYIMPIVSCLVDFRCFAATKLWRHDVNRELRHQRYRVQARQRKAKILRQFRFHDDENTKLSGMFC